MIKEKIEGGYKSDWTKLTPEAEALLPSSDHYYHVRSGKVKVDFMTERIHNNEINAVEDFNEMATAEKEIGELKKEMMAHYLAGKEINELRQKLFETYDQYRKNKLWGGYMLDVFPDLRNVEYEFRAWEEWKKNRGNKEYDEHEYDREEGLNDGLDLAKKRYKEGKFRPTPDMAKRIEEIK